MNFLKGKRTYILAVLALITIAFAQFGYVDVDTANTILAVLGFGSVITLRKAIK